MIVILLTERHLNKIYLPEKISGKFFIKDELENGENVNLIEIEAIEDVWYLKSTDYAGIIDVETDELCEKLVLRDEELYQLYLFDSDNTAQIITEKDSDDHKCYEKYKITTDTDLVIGRDDNCDIVFGDLRVSSLHLKLSYEKNVWTALDLNSTNGTYLNGDRLIEETRLKPGDVLYIVGMQIIILNDVVAINNPNQCVTVNENKLTQINLKCNESAEGVNVNGMTGFFFRSPRFKREVIGKDILVDAPPASYIKEEMPLIMLIGPSLTMAIASVTSASYSIVSAINNGNPYTAIPSMAMAISMMLGSILWPILSKKYEKKRNKRKEEERYQKYSNYLDKIQSQIKTEMRIEQEVINENNKDAHYWKDIVKTSDAMLWEKSITQDDFLSVRIGIGEEQSKIKFKYQERKFTMDDDDLQDKMLSICENAPKLYEVPNTVSLIENKIFGIVGTPSKRYAFLKNMLILLTSQHGYDELKVAFIMNEKQENELFDVRRLPHIWDNEKNVRYIATNYEEVKKLSVILDSQLDLNESKTIDNYRNYFLVFVLDKYLASKMEVLKKIYKNEKHCNASVISVFERYEELPKECSKFIEIKGENGRIYDRKDISGKRPNVIPDLFVGEEFGEYVTDLSKISLDLSNDTYNLPKLVTFLEMYDVGKIEHLNVLKRWKENNPVVSLETPIGINTMGEVFKLDLHEKAHGPHGLVAGMTGSGKSEFIMSFILSMAVNYHPNEVAFVLIDYKGGGMAKAFEKLPHTAGIITNLDGAAVRRSLISIQSELKRRQSIFSQTGEKVSESNIDIYKYQKLYREGRVSEPIPHLFIISDEFAELKMQQPEFMEQLVSAARIGRSLGVHLILATQKPAGVVDDQIWSNSKFKICLKVQDRADSMDMIKKPDAASLVETGRFYLQVGYDELFELGQSAWAGAPYIPAEKTIKQKDDSVDVLDRSGEILSSVKLKQQNIVQSEGKQLDMITSYLCDLAIQEDIHVNNLWLEPIPESIYIDELEEKYRYVSKEYILNPIIGEYDDPARQRQDLLTLPISEEGNVVIYGATGSGKTNFINAMIYSITKQHTPEEIMFYLLDFASETLKIFGKGPHIAGVYTLGDEEKIEYMFSYLTSEIEKRKSLFSEFGGNFTSYIQAGEKDVGNIVVVIHNYTGFDETYDQFEEKLQYLTREGVRYGIYFIFTVGSSSAIRYRMLQNFKLHYILQMNDSGEYTSVLGSTGGMIPSKYIGRGLFKADVIYEFQIANLPGGNEFIRDYTRILLENYGENKQSIGMPDRVTINSFSNITLDNFPVGISKDDYEEIYINLQAQPVWCITGNDDIQINHFIDGLVEAAGQVPNIEINLVDPTGSFEKTELINSHITDAIEEYIVNLFELVLYRNNTYKKNNCILPEGEVYIPHIEILYSFFDIRMDLSDDALDKIKTVLDKICSEYNVTFIIADTVPYMGKYINEKWAKTQKCNDYGVFIGNGFRDQYIFKNGSSNQQFRQSLKNNYGFVINHSVTLAKVLEPKED